LTVSQQLFGRDHLDQLMVISQNEPTARSRDAASFYLAAKSNVIANGFAAEIDWQEGANLNALSESVFLREAAWVILSSGLSEQVVRRCFPDISAAFNAWSSAEAIWRNRRTCRADALTVFSSERKIDAILAISGFVARYGFERCRVLLVNDGLDFLMKFKFLGPATGRHLAKNIGFPLAKPDRHLKRIACMLGYVNVSDLCTEIATLVGDSVPVVDVVLWRYATLNRSYATQLKLPFEHPTTRFS
jgi:hypothetical protein